MIWLIVELIRHTEKKALWPLVISVGALIAGILMLYIYGYGHICTRGIENKVEE